MIAKINDFPPVRACLFDMDGLLIDTEDIYTKCNNIILADYGKPNLPWSIKAQLQGRPGPEAAEIFHAWAQLPISRSDFAAKQAALQAKYFPTARPLPGTQLLLKTLSRTGSHIALATSSHAANFKLKTIHQEAFFSPFTQDKRVLGDDPRIPKGRGKPAPDIYLLALECINKSIRENGSTEKEVEPEECLVFEDSVPGVEAGRRAGMRVIWCPHPELLKEYKGREAEVLAGTAHGYQGQEDEKTVEKAGARKLGTGNVSPGTAGDGWAELVETLEAFPYDKYGIDA